MSIQKQCKHKGFVMILRVKLWKPHEKRRWCDGTYRKRKENVCFALDVMENTKNTFVFLLGNYRKRKETYVFLLVNYRKRKENTSVALELIENKKNI